MYYFGIVAKNDLDKGIIEPSYIAYRSNGESESRSKIRIFRENIDGNNNKSKFLICNPYEIQTIVDFMSNYRTRDHMHDSAKYDHEDTKKYYPQGALFMYECNVYGEYSGKAIFIKRVPDRAHRKTDDGKSTIDKEQNRTRSLKQLFLHDASMTILQQSTIKTVLPQRKMPVFK